MTMARHFWVYILASRRAGAVSHTEFGTVQVLRSGTRMLQLGLEVNREWGLA
jgi:hypothetical protein